MDINNPIQNTIIFYLLIMASIVILKPKQFYENNKIKSFGFDNNHTILSFHIVGIILPVILYALFALVNCIYLQ